MQLLSETACLSEEDKEELLQLISMTYQVTQNPHQAGYGDTSPVMEHIEGKIFPGVCVHAYVCVCVFVCVVCV